MTRAIAWLGVVLLLALGVGITANADVTVKVVAELDPSEPFEAHLFHAGHLWVGRSRKGLNADYHLDVYDSAGNRVATQTLAHSPRYLYPYGADAVLALGVSASPNLSRYTVARLRGSRLSLSLKSLPSSAWGNEFAGGPERLVFTDPGGKQGGVVDSVDDLGPAQTLFTPGFWGPRYLKARVRGPARPVVVGKTLFVIETPSIASGGTNVVAVDLVSEQSQRLLPESRNRLSNLVALKNGLLAVAEKGADQVLLLDSRNGRVTATLGVPSGSPQGLAELGHCLAVGSEQNRRVTFYDLRQADRGPVAEWDLSSAGDKLMGLRALAADPATGRVYGRSAYACNPLMGPCPKDRNSVVLAEDTTGETLRHCR